MLVQVVFYRVQSLATIVTNSLTTNYDCYLVDLVDVTLSCEDANSKLVEVVTFADERNVLTQGLKLKFRQDFDAEVWSTFCC